MDKKELKRLLAGVSIAGLLAGGTIPSTLWAADGKTG
jgi:radical SAM modification target selenobiotic family peptide